MSRSLPARRALAGGMLAAGLAAGLAGPARAVLEEPAADEVPPAAALCLAGTLWDPGSATCVAPETGLLPDDRLFAELRRLARSGRYAEARRMLDAMRERGTARVLTAEGFLLRRTGEVARGLALYAEALAIDPGHHEARAYLGLWFLEEGDIAAAADVLAEIEAAGGAGTEAWRLLAEALAEAGAP